MMSKMIILRPGLSIILTLQTFGVLVSIDNVVSVQPPYRDDDVN